jgi:hypothetical protein
MWCIFFLFVCFSHFIFAFYFYFCSFACFVAVWLFGWITFIMTCVERHYYLSLLSLIFFFHQGLTDVACFHFAFCSFLNHCLVTNNTYFCADGQHAAGGSVPGLCLHQGRAALAMCAGKTIICSFFSQTHFNFRIMSTFFFVESFFFFRFL